MRYVKAALCRECRTPKTVVTQPEDSLISYIPLTKNQFAIVDADHYEFLMQWAWHAQWNRYTNSFYACRKGESKNGTKGKWIAMHRVILGLDAGDTRRGDHVNNGQTLDNRIKNLRICTHTQNNQNKRIAKNNTSGFKGVTYHRQRGKWRAGIRFNKRFISLGLFLTKEEAHAAYCNAAVKYFGEFARAA